MRLGGQAGNEVGKVELCPVLKEPDGTFVLRIEAFLLDMRHKTLHASVEEFKKERAPSIFHAHLRQLDKDRKFLDDAEGFGTEEEFVEEVHQECMVFPLSDS